MAWPKIVCDTRKRTARQQGTQTPTVAGAPVLDPTTEEALVGWRAQSRKTPGGQPHYSNLAIETALTLRAVFRLALCQSEGLIGSIIKLLEIDLPVLDHSTLSRRACGVPVQNLPRSGTGKLHLIVDSTGLKLRGAGEWLFEKHGTSKRRTWRKIHVGIDADNGQIVAFDLTDKEIDDASHVEPLLEQLDDESASFMGDGAYDRAHVFNAIRVRNPDVRFIVPPCKGAGTNRNDRSDPAGFAHSFNQQTWAHELAENIRLQSTFESRSGDWTLQARHWGCVAFA